MSYPQLEMDMDSALREDSQFHTYHLRAPSHLPTEGRIAPQGSCPATVQTYRSFPPWGQRRGGRRWCPPQSHRRGTGWNLTQLTQGRLLERRSPPRNTKYYFIYVKKIFCPKLNKTKMAKKMVKQFLNCYCLLHKLTKFKTKIHN